MGEMKDTYKTFVSTPEWKRRLARPRSEWEDDIKVDVKEIGCKSVDWNNIVQFRVWWHNL
jgi:hypothetical protein